MLSTVDPRAVLVGTVVALAVIVPAVVVAAVAGADQASWGVAYTAVVVAATFAGSAVAGRRGRPSPAFHGALSGVATFLLAQLVASVVRAQAPNPLGLIAFALAFAGLGALGGLVGTVRVLEPRPGPGGSGRADGPRGGDR